MENKEIDRTDLAYAIAEKTGHSPVIVLDVLKHLPAAIAEGLASHNRVESRDLGTFKLKKRKPREGKIDGHAWATADRLKIVYKASPLVAEIVATKTGTPTY